MGHLGVDTDLLRRFLARVGTRARLSRACLVGSRARGDELVHSDYDVVLVSEDWASQTLIQRLESLMPLWEGDVDVHILPLTPEELRDQMAAVGTVAEAMKAHLALVL